MKKRDVTCDWRIGLDEIFHQSKIAIFLGSFDRQRIADEIRRSMMNI